MKIILTPEERAIWVEAWRRWGDDHQARMAMEECAETITAVAHLARGRCNVHKVIEEFADSFVCTGQVINHELRFDDEGLEIEVVMAAAIEHAFAKLRAKLDENDKNHGANR